ncbi:MAG: LysE family translocator [Roseococcus sp.]|nr:LysE family translocator [Roseococcus sp.]
MPDSTTLLLFLAAALVLALSPGPGMLYVAARSMAAGRRAGVLSSLGTGVGGLAHVLAGALGVSALVLASAELFTLLKLAGALYLLWLGWRTFRNAGEEQELVLGRAGRPFREGVLVEALNPKTAAFFLAFLPQFVSAEAGSVLVQFAVLGTLCVVLNTGVDLLVALLAERLRQGLLDWPGMLRRLRQGSGAALAALGLGVLLFRRPA